MPRYFVYHQVKRVFNTQDAWVEDLKSLRARSTGQAAGPRWLRSWFAAAESEMICEWEAPDPSSIPGCFTPEELEMAPIVRVQEVAYFDAAWLE
jgi:hypothetical protein